MPLIVFLSTSRSLSVTSRSFSLILDLSRYGTAGLWADNVPIGYAENGKIHICTLCKLLGIVSNVRIDPLSSREAVGTKVHIDLPLLLPLTFHHVPPLHIFYSILCHFFLLRSSFSSLTEHLYMIAKIYKTPILPFRLSSPLTFFLTTLHSGTK